MKEHTALKIIIAVIAGVFVFHQIYSSVYKPITTQTAEYFEAVDGQKIAGVIIRNESIVRNTSGGVLHFVTDDGSRVAKDGVIADIYDNAAASVTVSKIQNVSQQISAIKEIQAYNDVQAADLDLLNGKVMTSLNKLIFNSSAGNYSFAEDDCSELLTAVNRRQMVTGEQTDFSAKLSALEQELNTLNASLPTARGSIRADRAGYFVSGFDGYEGVLSCEDLNKITPDYLSNIKPEKISDGAIGKIVSDYEWYIAAKMSINDSLRYKQDDVLTIKTNLKSSEDLPVTVKQINVSDTSDEAVVIFSCQTMNSSLAAVRFGNMTAVQNTYNGFKISKKALRVKDGKTGVYVLTGSTVKFVPIDVIYNTEDYVICKKDNSEDNALRLYDEVVVKGKKLYDGKVVG